MLGYLYKIPKINVKLWCYVQSNSSFYSESSPLFTCNVSRSVNSLNKSYQSISMTYSKWETIFILAVCDIFVRSRHFEKPFVRLVKSIYKTTCLHRMSSLGSFCSLLIFPMRRRFVQTGLVQNPPFRYRFQAICCEFRKCRCVLF